MTPRTTNSVDAVLDVTIQDTAGIPTTIGAYLTEVLATLWEDGDGFDPRAPLGRVDWQRPIYEALVKLGFVPGVFEDGRLGAFDMTVADDLVAAAVRKLGAGGVVPILRTSDPCIVHHSHSPNSHVNEHHHVWPLGHGGPNIPANIITVCPTGHLNIHALLNEFLLLHGEVSYSVQKSFAVAERQYAQLGYERITRGAM